MCQNGSSSQLFGCLLLEQHLGGNLAPLLTGVLEDVKVIGSYDVTQFVGHGPVLCVLALKRSQQDDWLGYGSTDPVFLRYNSKTEQMFDIRQLRTNKRSKAGFNTVVDVMGCKEWWLRKIQLASISSCEAEWPKFGNFAGLTRGCELVVVDPPVFDGLEILFELEAK